MTQAKLNLVAGLLVVSALIGGLFSASPAYAVNNPLIRTCMIALGTFETYPLGTDDMALCRWNKLIVDSQTLLSNLNGLNSEAASVILSNITGTSCASVSATDYTIPTGEVLCFFPDDSRLSLEGLKSGSSDSDRLHLKEVLSAR
ncbi:hypothetical protein BH10BDE1_BH10BDE1_13030 [soil metagenome]